MPPVSHKGMLVMVHDLGDDDSRHQVTALNFGQEEITGTIRSKLLIPRSVVLDMASGEEVGEVDDLNSFSVSLDGHDGVSLMVTPPAPVEDEETT